MSKLDWVLICQRAIVSRENSMSVIDIVDEVTIPAPPPDFAKKMKAAPTAPMLPIRFAVVSKWSRNSENVPEAATTLARVRLVAPNGKTFGNAEFSVDLRLNEKAQISSEAQGLPYVGPGTYFARIERQQNGKWIRVGSASLKLKHIAESKPN